MRSFDRRDVTFAQAREELSRTLADDCDDVTGNRDERIAEAVRTLRDKYPDLDEQMTERLMGEEKRQPISRRDPI
jgi:hypothetical protein